MDSYIKKNHPDFITASYHNGDPMQVTTDYPLNISGFPEASFDRRFLGDPYGETFSYHNDFSVIKKITELNSAFTPWALDVSHTWINDSTLTANVDFTNVYGYKNESYKIGYLLVCDGVRNSNKEWNQSNQYHSELPSYIPELNNYCKGGVYGQKIIENHVFNDVVISIDGYLGIIGSVPDSLNPEEIISHRNIWNLNEIKPELILDKNKLRIIAYVIDENGCILNSAKEHVIDYRGVESICFENQQLDCYIGDDVILNPIINSLTLKDSTLLWTSSNPNIASVNNGTVSCHRAGETCIAATTLNGLSAYCKIVVNPILANEITLSHSCVDLKIGESVLLDISINPVNTTDKNVNWTTSDPSIATVENGLVEAVGVGEVIIKATTINNLFAECKVNVKPIEAEFITFDITEIETFVGDCFTIKATVNPENTTDKTLKWSTSDENVVIVDSDGGVSCIGEGDAIITATANNGVNVKCIVIVSNVLVESISIVPESIEGERGDKIQLTATILPENATNKTVKWTSDNNFMAKVEDTGLVTIMRTGSTTIHASATDGSGVVADCDVIGVSDVEQIFIDGLKWNLYSIDGILICKNISLEDLKQLEPSVYFISNEHHTIKFVKK